MWRWGAVSRPFGVHELGGKLIFHGDGQHLHGKAMRFGVWDRHLAWTIQNLWNTKIGEEEVTNLA